MKPKPTRITDTQRLDWLAINLDVSLIKESGWRLYYKGNIIDPAQAKTLRGVIDKAMKGAK